MTIRKGETWGGTGPLPSEAVLVHSDAEAGEVVTEARRAGETPPPLGLLGGDLCRTLGGRGDEQRLRSDSARRLPLDCGAVLVDGRLHWFVAHAVVRSGAGPLSWWTGRLVAYMNAQFHGKWNVAPRAHPNDGRLDVLDTDMPVGERIKARRRLGHGTHVPHPDIKQRRVDAAQLELDRPGHVWLDGRHLGSAQRLAVRVEPDVLTCYV